MLRAGWSTPAPARRAYARNRSPPAADAPSPPRRFMRPCTGCSTRQHTQRCRAGVSPSACSAPATASRLSTLKRPSSLRAHGECLSFDGTGFAIDAAARTRARRDRARCRRRARFAGLSARANSAPTACGSALRHVDCMQFATERIVEIQHCGLQDPAMRTASPSPRRKLVHRRRDSRDGRGSGS